MDVRWEDEVLIVRPTACRGKVVLRPGGAPGGAGLDCVVLLVQGARTRAVSFPVREGGMGEWQGPKPEWWGMRREGLGCWVFSPSVVAGDVHEVIRLVGVPEPPPWHN